MHRILTSLMLTIAAVAMHAAALGTWTHYYAYTELTHVVPTQQNVYALSAGRLFAYRPSDQSVSEMNTMTGMGSPELINSVTYNPTTRTVCAAYADGTIDLVGAADHTDVYTIRAIRDQSTTLLKQIVGMTVHEQYVFLVLPERLVQVNTQRKEITDTYTFSSAGATFTGAYVTADSIYLASSTAITTHQSATMLAVSRKANLADRSQWQAVSGSRESRVRGLIADNATLYGVSTTTYVEDTYHNCQWGADADGQLMMYNVQDDGTTQAAWLKGVRPEGPATNNFYHIFWKYNQLYTVGMGWNKDASATSAEGSVQVLTPNGWHVYDQAVEDGVTMNRTQWIDIDPRDTAHVMVGARSGLYEFYNGKFVKWWNNDNSLIKSMNDGINKRYLMLMGCAYDAKGYLYAINANASNVVLGFDQTTVGQGSLSDWKHYPNSALDNITDYDHHAAKAKIDASNVLWFVELSHVDQAFYAFDPRTETIVKHTALTNQNSTEYINSEAHYMRDIAFDRSGNVWVASTKGVAYLPKSLSLTETSEVYQPIVPRNDGTGLADYLLDDVSSTCILFDSADRLYVGTQSSGVFVISADRNTQLAHYTTDNSDILSDNIYYMALDSNTGTLYMATDKGLCSVVTDGVVMPSSLDKNEITVYPNPVPPTHTGMINIKGVVSGADIRITTATGYVVHQGTTSGPIYQWDGCDGSGKRCASGVYNILLATPDGEEGTVAKVALVN